MELIYNFIRSRKAQLTGLLLEAGIPADRADDFLDQASIAISNTLVIQGIERLLVSFVSGNVDRFLSDIDLQDMSQHLQMDYQQVFTGMYAIWPVISGIADNDDEAAQLEASRIYSKLTSA